MTPRPLRFRAEAAIPAAGPRASRAGCTSDNPPPLFSRCTEVWRDRAQRFVRSQQLHAAGNRKKQEDRFPLIDNQSVSENSQNKRSDHWKLNLPSLFTSSWTKKIIHVVLLFNSRQAVSLFTMELELNE